MTDPLTLQYLKSIDEKIDKLSEDLIPRVRMVENWQSNVDGKISMFGLICVALGGFVTWLTSLFHK